MFSFLWSASLNFAIFLKNEPTLLVDISIYYLCPQPMVWPEIPSNDNKSNKSDITLFRDKVYFSIAFLYIPVKLFLIKNRILLLFNIILICGTLCIFRPLLTAPSHQTWRSRKPPRSLDSGQIPELTRCTDLALEQKQI